MSLNCPCLCCFCYLLDLRPSLSSSHPRPEQKLRCGKFRTSLCDGATATLEETIRYNIWGYSKRTRTMIKRTTVLATMSFINAFLQVAATIEGADLAGAAGWASIWAVAASVTGLMFWWVGDVDGIRN